MKQIGNKNLDTLILLTPKSLQKKGLYIVVSKLFQIKAPPFLTCHFFKVCCFHFSCRHRRKAGWGNKTDRGQNHLASKCCHLVTTKYLSALLSGPRPAGSKTRCNHCDLLPSKGIEKQCLLPLLTVWDLQSCAKILQYLTPWVLA